MLTLTLEQANRTRLLELLSQDRWTIACLCAAWCDVCTMYKPAFERLASQHPDTTFLWIDIEDQSDVVGDFDVENFPTLLIQHRDTIVFYGSVQPEIRVAERLFTSQLEKTNNELQAEAMSTKERQRWQVENNLRIRLQEIYRS
jgi:thioredoxin 1